MLMVVLSSVRVPAPSASSCRGPARSTGILLEPSGAAGLAAIATHDLPGERLATVLTGSNPHPRLLAAVLTGDRP
jgi:threonine dehydratase